MNAWSAWTRAIRAGLACCALLPGLSPAQGIESVLQPGPVIQGHAKWEHECATCHVKFNRKAQDGQCMDCHKDIGQDVRGKTGYHGRLKPQACNSCHTDHKGRGAQIVEFDPKRFDHRQSDYLLRGAHEKTACDKCHVAGKKWREAALECSACHRKDDAHKGSLGPKCADCHSEKNWKETRFDHALTRFPLGGKHVDTPCRDCHKDKEHYTAAPKTCIGCHRKDDDGPKGHQGLYGAKCESCHDAKAWKPSTFNHDSDTRYPLRGRHRATPCSECHAGALYKLKTSTVCYDCHKQDDKHKDSLGRECGSCHTERGWKETLKFDHDATSFPLLGKHIDARCEACHKSPVFKDAPKSCHTCHKSEDKHRGSLGEQCGDCHGERDWKVVKGRFDHGRTKFPLRNAHAAPKVKCDACHQDLLSYRKTAVECQACHKKDDKHEGQLGPRCEQCHDDRSWKVASFDHARARFPLVGQHIGAKCQACHETARYRDAKRECYACHAKEDRHKLKFGERCDACHNARAWPIWEFDHTRRSSYPLDGAHRKVACEACHTRPAPAGKAFAPVGSSCIGCHRKDDAHDGGFGLRCEQCHAPEAWRKITNGRARGAVGTGTLQ